jgi:hypothetical protein
MSRFSGDDWRTIQPLIPRYARKSTNDAETVGNPITKNEIKTVESEIIDTPQGVRPGICQDDVPSATESADEQYDDEDSLSTSEKDQGTSSESKEEDDNWIDHSGPPRDTDSESENQPEQTPKDDLSPTHLTKQEMLSTDGASGTKKPETENREGWPHSQNTDLAVSSKAEETAQACSLG